ncbi:GyrI-like domain-containing protein [Clostridium gasigenes]|uniref:GyrI-like domain-containing protein n=1 Tax=Clostridium gasigenes TaxID=94869 RepID=UPI0016245468|nr:GyrI-like domain-containing protein [Clostridium gasigenes]MBB6625456.1 GyrI-like domain-containing protein [Clostridium gasigenes]MBU3132309.1 GyrI-like domain-containing protein [Clostridium gasigenes]
MKHEWRRHEKEYYIPKEKPALVDIPEFKFFMIKGKGNPNSEEFSEAIGVLYSLAYAIKMMPKNGYTPEGYFEYTVYPLEGIWDLTEVGKKQKILNKDEFIYKIMIRQPDFVTEELIVKAMEIVKKKKPHKLLDKVTFATIKDELSVQMLHIGSFDDEPKSFSIMKEYCEENNLIIKTKAHREIYLSDLREIETEKLKTVLRYCVE